MSPGDSPVREVRAAAYRVPTDAPEADGTLSWDATTVVIVHVDAGDVTGVGWTYGDPGCVVVVRGVLADTVTGFDVIDVPGLWHAMQRRVRNAGRAGVVSSAMSAVEIALWDAAAQLVGLPVSRLLGRCHETLSVYGSGGFTSYGDEQLREQVTGWVQQQRIPRIKIKIGESWGRRIDRDLARVGRVRELVGDAVELFVDANGGYSVGQAVRVGGELDALGVTWYEEPVSSDDLAGLREVRAQVGADVAAGEYGYDLPYFSRMLQARAVDCLQLDVTRCGGFHEWLRAAAAAAAANVAVSAHCAPNLSTHVAAATPNIRHLEWFHDHDRIERMLFDGVLDPAGGAVHPDVSTAGHGMTFKHRDAEQYLIA